MPLPKLLQLYTSIPTLNASNTCFDDLCTQYVQHLLK